MERQNRKLSGIFLRYQGTNWCFEDLPVEKQNKFMDKLEKEALRRMCMRLAGTINEIAEQFNITKNQDNNG